MQTAPPLPVAQTNDETMQLQQNDESSVELAQPAPWPAREADIIGSECRFCRAAPRAGEDIIDVQFTLRVGGGEAGWLVAQALEGSFSVSKPIFAIKGLFCSKQK